ncbi:MAG: hypothetical protein U1E42_08395 [Rhodospirillales bacterium]
MSTVVASLTPMEAAAGIAARALALAQKDAITPRQISAIARSFGVCRSIVGAAVGVLVARASTPGRPWAYGLRDTSVVADIHPSAVALWKEARR